MKFLLTGINAKYIHSNPAIHSLVAYAGEELHPYVELAEYTINQQLHAVLSDIYIRKPDVIGFSCYIWNWKMIQELLTELPKILPGVDIWLGGPEVTYHAEKILEQYPFLTGIMVGEGEETFRDLLTYYVEKEMRQSVLRGDSNDGLQTGSSCSGDAREKLQKIAGLCLPEGYTAVRELTDLSKIPFLYEDLAPFQNRILYYETSRGCPYRCSYCLSSIDKKVRFRDMELVKKELQFFLDHKVPQVKFIDRTFNCDHIHAMEIWRYIYEHDNGVTNFHFEISADILREDEIALLNRFRPGLAQLEIGVQSANEPTIRSINRVMNLEKLEQIVAAIHQGNNIHMHLDLIAGLPYEDYETFGRSFNRVYAMHPEQLQLGFLKVLKGSEMENTARELGIAYLQQPPYEVLHTPWLPFGDLLRLKEVEEMVELYYNSNQFTHTIAFLEHAFETPFRMFECMASFYKEKGYFLNSPARVYRYNVLLDFACRYDGEHTNIYKELLTYDLYLRENAKSRPDFAPDLTDPAVKEAAREFYRGEEENRNYLVGYEGYDWKQMSKMTHFEPFRYSVWNVEQLWEEKAGSTTRYVLFDYRNRSPLTHEAFAFVITPSEAGGI